MLFSSIPFLYYFLPLVFAIYFLAPKNLRNGVLLLSSLFFYAWGEPKYIILMALSILLGYILGILIEKHRETHWSKIYLTLSLVTSLGLLGYFKYADFFIENFNAITGLKVPLLRIALPIGISFYTFQILSYTIDVYRGEAKAQKNLIKLATYVALFPQLIAGPIVRYVDVAKELDSRETKWDMVYEGLRRFIIGLSKKVLIANTLGELTAFFMDSKGKSILFYWVYGIAFSLQIYFDFSGYSDMAIGLGKVFGFNFLENFNYPFISKSITEFWRRWHMSLGSWFRDYVYIPLGGNRVTKLRWLFNISVVWMLTGFWHGAAWNFVLWGLFFAILLILEKLWLLDILEKVPKFFSHLYVIFFTVISFVLFNASSFAGAIEDIGGLFGLSTPTFTTIETSYYLRSYGLILIVAIIGATPLGKNLMERLWEIPKVKGLLKVIEPLFLALLFIMVTAYLVDGSFNPFLYFRF